MVCSHSRLWIGTQFCFIYAKHRGPFLCFSNPVRAFWLASSFQSNTNLLRSTNPNINSTYTQPIIEAGYRLSHQRYRSKPWVNCRPSQQFFPPPSESTFRIIGTPRCFQYPSPQENAHFIKSVLCGLRESLGKGHEHVPGFGMSPFEPNVVLIGDTCCGSMLMRVLLPYANMVGRLSGWLWIPHQRSSS